jgi:hypothetical protein
MFIAALFTIPRLWKQPTFPTTDEWIMKMWCLYTMEFYSATKNKTLSFTSKWMELENIFLSKVSQAQKAKNHMLSLICRLLTWKNAVRLLDMGHTLKGEHAREE